MSQFLEQRELFDGILLLNEEERRDPIKVVERFFSDYRLHECRHILWAMVETCLTSYNTEFSEPGERADLLWRYKDIERVLEAGTLLVQQSCRQSERLRGNGDSRSGAAGDEGGRTAGEAVKGEMGNAGD